MAAPHKEPNESMKEYLLRISSKSEAFAPLKLARLLGTSYGDIYDKYLEPQSWKDEREEVRAYRKRMYKEELERLGPEMAAQGRGIESVASPVEQALMFAPAMGGAVKALPNIVKRGLQSRRIIRDPSGAPRPFYHGTRGPDFGPLDPLKSVQSGVRGTDTGYLSRGTYFTPKGDLAGGYATVGSASPGGIVPGARVFKHGLAPRKPFIHGKTDPTKLNKLIAKYKENPKISGEYGEVPRSILKTKALKQLGYDGEIYIPSVAYRRPSPSPLSAMSPSGGISPHGEWVVLDKRAILPWGKQPMPPLPSIESLAPAVVGPR